jgi:hypothetical protein
MKKATSSPEIIPSIPWMLISLPKQWGGQELGSLGPLPPMPCLENYFQDWRAAPKGLEPLHGSVHIWQTAPQDWRAASQGRSCKRLMRKHHKATHITRLESPITGLPTLKDCILSQHPEASSLQHTVCILVQARSNITFKTGMQPLRRVYVTGFRAALQDWRPASRVRPHQTVGGPRHRVDWPRHRAVH